MSKKEVLATHFSEEDVDNFDLSALKGANKSEEEDSNESTDQLAAEAEEKGVTVEELRAQKDEETITAEAKEKGVSVEELKAQKAEEEENAELEEEAEKLGLSVEELREQRAEEAKEAEEKEIEAEAKKTGKTVEEIKAERESASEEKFDLFSDFKSETAEGEETELKIDFSSAIKEVGLELEDGEEIKTEEEFVAKVKKGLESARQTLNLDEYPPEVKMVLENLKKNNNLYLTDWYRNDKIRQYDNFLAKDDKVKVINVLRAELQSKYSDPEELKEAVEDAFDDLTEVEVQAKVREINKNMVRLRNKEMGVFLAEKNKWLEDQDKLDSQRVEKERKAMVEKVKSMKTFLGFPIPEPAIKTFVKDIESGAFQKHLDKNAVETKIFAYLHDRLGAKLEKGLEQLLSKERNAAYKQGTDTITKHKHNIRKDVQSTGRTNKGKSLKGMQVDDSYFDEK